MMGTTKIRTKSGEKKRIGIVDVAKAAGVSPATVSRVLHNRPVVDPHVRDHVRETISKLNYRPNFAARHLPSGRTGHIAVATPRGSHELFANPYATRVLEGIGQVLDETSLHLVLSTTPAQFENLLKSYTVDGILLLSIEMEDPFIDDLEGMDVPVAVIGAYRTETRFATYTPDYAGAVRMAVEYLAGIGHARLGFICGPPNNYKWRSNQAAFEKALEKLGLQEMGSIVTHDYGEQTAYDAIVDRIRKGAQLPSAYVSTSDIMAIGMMKAAQDSGLSVPGDLSVVSYGDIPRAALSTPPLTTVGGDFVGIGAEATRTLISMIEEEIEEPPQCTIPLELVTRKSTAPPKS